MRTALIVGIVMLFILMQFISGWMQETYGLSPAIASEQQQTLQPDIPQQTSLIGEIQAYVSIGYNYLQTAWSWFWFHPEMFTGSWSIIWWIFFFPMSAGMVIGIVFVLRGVTNF
jgi:hypothetical protein